MWTFIWTAPCTSFSDGWHWLELSFCFLYSLLESFDNTAPWSVTSSIIGVINGPAILSPLIWWWLYHHVIEYSAMDKKCCTWGSWLFYLCDPKTTDLSRSEAALLGTVFFRWSRLCSILFQDICSSMLMNWANGNSQIACRRFPMASSL